MPPSIHRSQHEFDCSAHMFYVKTTAGRLLLVFGLSILTVSLAITMPNEVHVLHEGYSFSKSGNIMRANCSCTLIKGIKNFNVIVDTMTPWDKDKILQELAAKHVKPEDISVVVNTHGHSDHTGNNNLFTNAKWLISGESISERDKYVVYDFKVPYKLTDDICVMSTPGHTLTCVSVIVDNTKQGHKVAICGDLFEKEEDIMDCSIWRSAGSEDPEKQAINREKISNLVDYIIPGHGKGFIVTDEIRLKLKEDLS